MFELLSIITFLLIFKNDNFKNEFIFKLICFNIFILSYFGNKNLKKYINIDYMNRPKVGVSVVLKYNNNILVGKRKGSHGDGTWAFPGGHLEYGEDPIECAKRELLEETNINVSQLKPKLTGYTNDIFKKENKHYITLYVEYELDKILEAKLMEPNKCYEWKWFHINDIPKPHFIPLENYIYK